MKLEKFSGLENKTKLILDGVMRDVWMFICQETKRMENKRISKSLEGNVPRFDNIQDYENYHLGLL